MGKLRIAIISGGWSGEREISLKSGDTVYNALDRRKYLVTRYDPRDDLVRLIRDRKRIDLAFILLHGRPGEDGSIQGFLDLLGTPYVGSGVLSSALAMNKKVAKEMYRRVGLKVAKDVILYENQAVPFEKLLSTLGPSTVVKPLSEGSSLGMSICHCREEIENGIALAFQYDREVMVEEYIQGREVTCCVLGNRVLEALPPIEIIPSPGYPFFDYQAKYTPGATREICPAPLSKTKTREVQTCAEKAHGVLGCKAWSRTDMILKGKDVYVLETNTIPGMTQTSLVPLAAKTAGLSLRELLDRLIQLSLDQGP